MIPRFLPAILTAVLLSFGCGYVGGPLTPLANIPFAPADLAALQRGGAILAHFTVPTMTTEHVAIQSALTLDLRIGVWPEHASVETWAAGAKRIANPKMVGGLAAYEIPAAEWAGKEVVIAARVAGANRKESAWSNYVVLPVVTAPDRPADVTATSALQGVRLTWRANGEHFRVLRKAGDETGYTVVAADVTQHEWTDPQAAPGTAYSYLVQTIVPLANKKEAESELSEVKITPEVPLPQAPAGLAAVPATNTIELTWEAPPGDVAGYRIYRATGSGDFGKIADVNGIPTYSDHAVEHGKSYRYAVAAVNPDGREGPRSDVKDVVIP
ncbi:MAG: fibronectin type III domain-containing protein [Candidatus Sulfopaludibacter sp.]|nr:fibronectin type III domain-containing protein [Candidatus Sulfopaludibacter sp.]